MYNEDISNWNNNGEDQTTYRVETVTMVAATSDKPDDQSSKQHSTGEIYDKMNKPSWAPPAWLFPLVWIVLYILIVISFGYLFWLGAQGKVSWNVMIPLILNLVFNVLYFPLQFWFKSTILATIDVYLVLATLIWAMVMIWMEAPEDSWTAYVLIPYLLWVIFACVLQTVIAYKGGINKCKC